LVKLKLKEQKIGIIIKIKIPNIAGNINIHADIEVLSNNLFKQSFMV